MKITPIFLGLILLIFLALPVMAANNHDGEGEKNVTILDKDGNVLDNAIHASDDDKDETSSAKDTESDDSDDSDSGDVWGIKQSDLGFDSLANINTLGGVYMGITPFRNMSLISISVSAGLAITFVIVGIFILLMLAGVGAGHPNVKKGWDLLRGAQGKIAAIGLVFALALFVIILVFFTITIFGKIIILMSA